MSALAPWPESSEAGAASARAWLRLVAPAEPTEHAQPDAWDEMRGDANSLRPPWQRFAELLPAAPALDLPVELDRRAAQVAQRIALDGVTHNVFSEQAAASRPWSLELLPLLISAQEWALIEAGVMQRAALLEAILVDLHGARRLLVEGLLPPALVMRNPGYLRPLQGVPPAGGQRLHIVAFDLARDDRGQWCIVSQRTQNPSGLGYVLHNRLVISRQFPEAFREMRVQRLASSYRRLLDTVDAHARELAGGATPRIVLLTSGPYTETYFEHAYLARYLGVPLVEGGDLTVRNARLYLKTVEGLEPVHGMLRRLDDVWCDPLELRSDSALGVPGLLQAVRAGTVVMANALGSGLLESPGCMGFMPGMAQRLLGEPLQMPSLPTWWCGEAAAWAPVRDRLHDKLLRRSFPRGERAPDDRWQWPAHIENDPDAWTLQRKLPLSRTPLWADGAIAPRPALVRVYAISDAHGRWHVLPGGMTRVAPSDDGSVSMQRGGSSLDTWVLTDGAVDTFSMLPQRLHVDDILQRHRPVSSRAAENLFWLGRYTERTEQLVRLVRASLARAVFDSEAASGALRALSTLAVKTGLAPWGVPTLLQAPQHFERAVLMGLGDVEGSSIAYNLAAMERSSQALRERLSVEHWRLIRSMSEGFAAALKQPEGVAPALSQVMPALDRLALQLAAVTGAQTDRMTRDHGWRLLTVGRLIERLQGLCQCMQALLENEVLASAAGIDLLLELFDSTITFRARYQRSEDPLALADLLVLESANPRSFAGVLRRLRTELGKLPGDAQTRAEFIAMLPAQGAGMELESLRDASDAQIAQAMLALSRSLYAKAVALAEGLGARYFTLAQGADQAV